MWTTMLVAAVVLIAAFATGTFTLQQTLVLWVAFMAGQLLNVLKQAAMAIRNPHNPVKTRRDYVYRNWDILVLRGAVGVLLFWTYKTWPDGLTMLLAHFGVQFNLNLPLIPPVALGLGLASDFCLDWVAVKLPFLQKDLPRIDTPPDPPDAGASGQAAGK
jgi:hypothetical protein